MFTFDESILSDLHKDAHGFRPGAQFWYTWDNSTAEEKQAIWDRLLVSLKDSIDEDRAREERDIADLEETIRSTISYGAGNRETALRWLTQNEEFDNSQDVEHWVWKQGVLFTEFGRNLVRDLGKMWGIPVW